MANRTSPSLVEGAARSAGGGGVKPGLLRPSSPRNDGLGDASVCHCDRPKGERRELRREGSNLCLHLSLLLLPYGDTLSTREGDTRSHSGRPKGRPLRLWIRVQSRQGDIPRNEMGGGRPRMNTDVENRACGACSGGGEPPHPRGAAKIKRRLRMHSQP